jgi:peptidoglycan/LPS O-acetylase OafA/YrhL
MDVEALKHPVHTSSKPGTTHSRVTSWDQMLSLILRLINYPPPNSFRLRRTSWLDGVRGVAATAVFLFHAMGCWAPIVPAWRADTDQTSLLQLPFVRTIFVSGGGAVSVFFVLSGYVLTHRSLRLIRNGSVREVYSCVASSTFRRGFRLYLPPVLLTFCEMLSTRLGYAPPLNFEFVPEPTLLGQFGDWLAETNRLVNPIQNFGGAIRGIVVHPKYDAVIWTIPVEFYGSMVCYLLLFTLAGVQRTTPRMASVAVLCLLSMASGSWNIACFTAGMLIADFNLGQDDDSTTLITTTKLNTTTSPTNTTKRPLLWTTILLISFYILGFPTLVFPSARTSPMPGFETLRALIPASISHNMEDPARFWWSVAGIALLLSISQLPRLKAVFETYLCQYLAKISFALYLVHEFCLVLFGLRLQGALMAFARLDQDQQSTEKGVGYWVVCCVWFVVFTVPVFALAAQVERWVDVPSVRFAKGLEERCLRAWREGFALVVGLWGLVVHGEMNLVF